MQSKFFELEDIKPYQSIVITSEKKSIDFVANPIHVVVNIEELPRPEYIIDSDSFITEKRLKVKTEFSVPAKGKYALVLIETKAAIDINKIKVLLKS